jgi:hypothetical protein
MGIDLDEMVVKTDFEETGCECLDWIKLAQDRLQ